MPLYLADSAFGLAYKTLDTAFTTERNNRAYFWNLSPEIKHTLDKLRPQAQQAADDYLAGRAAYIANPTPAGLTGLQAILAKAQQLVFAVNAAIGVGTVPATATPLK